MINVCNWDFTDVDQSNMIINSQGPTIKTSPSVRHDAVLSLSQFVYEDRDCTSDGNQLTSSYSLFKHKSLSV